MRCLYLIFFSFSLWDVKYSFSSLTMFHTAVGAQYHSENTWGRCSVSQNSGDNSHLLWRACMAVIKIPSSSTDCPDWPTCRNHPIMRCLLRCWAVNKADKSQDLSRYKGAVFAQRRGGQEGQLRVWGCGWQEMNQREATLSSFLCFEGSSTLQHLTWRGCGHLIMQGWTQSCGAQGCYLRANTI